MARSIEEIKNSIIAAKMEDKRLNGLDSESSTAIWSVWVYIMAVAIYTHELIFDQFKEEVEDILTKQIPGTASWYAEKLKEFRSGISLPPGGITYEDPSKGEAIITRVSYKETDGTLALKVAKDKEGGEVGELDVLTAEELRNATTYLEHIKYAGTRLSVTSHSADQLYLKADIYYDTFFSPEEVRVAIVDAVREFMKGLDFTGKVYANHVVDAIQGVSGVMDVNVVELSLTDNTDTESFLVENYRTINRRLDTYAGYIAESIEENRKLDYVEITTEPDGTVIDNSNLRMYPDDDQSEDGEDGSQEPAV
ncbi:hypothetical protein [Xanthovirga aplysinae]|uniref:hypothetical protein n=1 Tax=Xanthovirga aplysinae TaxID=2529853 RepID=UPI0012BC5F88|nr:hypothetical protein [Xanthovirga aplysinae]MTI33159.1 hypothetical protein [Xanthovirga aplysinae]